MGAQPVGRALHGFELFHFTVGPQLAAGGAAGGVLSLSAGQRFPVHRHHGNEVTYVLEGITVADGRVYGPSSQIEMPKDTSHDYQAAPRARSRDHGATPEHQLRVAFLPHQG